VQTLAAAKAAAMADMEQARKSARTAAMWAAAQKADAASAASCPSPVPPLTSLPELVALLRQEDTRAAVELGCGDPHSRELLTSWAAGVANSSSPVNVSFVCVPAAGADPSADPRRRPGWAEFQRSMLDTPLQVSRRRRPVSFESVRKPTYPLRNRVLEVVARSGGWCQSPSRAWVLGLPCGSPVQWMRE
jgi:hypothetical protein